MHTCIHTYICKQALACKTIQRLKAGHYPPWSCNLAGIQAHILKGSWASEKCVAKCVFCTPNPQTAKP